MKNAAILLTCLLIASFVSSQTISPRKIVLHGDTLIALDAVAYDSLLSKLEIKGYFIQETMLLNRANDSLKVKVEHQKEIAERWKIEAEKQELLIVKLNSLSANLETGRDLNAKLLRREEKKRKFWQITAGAIAGYFLIKTL